jgi:Response regulator with putative antiterminator output domain
MLPVLALTLPGLLRQQEQLSEQLQEALKSRVVIEQAKGIIAHQHSFTVDQAYQLMRRHARNNNTSLRMVAEAIVARRQCVDLQLRRRRSQPVNPPLAEPSRGSLYWRVVPDQCRLLGRVSPGKSVVPGDYRMLCLLG